MKIYREITPLISSDVFVVLDSVNKGFDYPIHNHPEYEINLVLGGAGIRIVGDSTEKYQGVDCVLIGPYLFHKWDDSDRMAQKGDHCRVITLQFDMHLFDKSFLSRKPFYHITEMLKNAQRGIRFTGNTLLEVKNLMEKLTLQTGIKSVLSFLQLLNVLSKSSEYEYLASEGFDCSAVQTTSKRLHVAYQYIIQHFTDQNLKMHEVASMVSLSDSAFSHFFKKNTNKSFSRFLIDMRLGYASKLLVETDDLVNDICFQAGFNNHANFNRLFKKYHHCTPLQFRKMYQEKSNFDWMEQHTPGQFLPADQKLHPELKPVDYGTKLIHS